MPVYCSVCGRQLIKSDGPIGPKCLEKISGHKKACRISKQKYIEYMESHDIFAEEDMDESGQVQTASSSSSTEKNVKEKKKQHQNTGGGGKAGPSSSTKNKGNKHKPSNSGSSKKNACSKAFRATATTGSKAV